MSTAEQIVAYIVASGIISLRDVMAMSFDERLMVARVLRRAGV